jgi:hypothetical protein
MCGSPLNRASIASVTRDSSLGSHIVMSEHHKLRDFVVDFTA